jgi:putative ABC transport system permease protein
MRYAVLTVWHEKRRFLGGVIAVAVSNVLITLMVGLVVGLFGLVSLPVDLSDADVWVTASGVPSCDLASLISRDWQNDLQMQPGVSGADEFIQSFAAWQKEGLGNVLVVVLGVNIDRASLGPIKELSREQIDLLSEEGAVVVDRGERQRLGIDRIGDLAEIYGHQVRVVGVTDNMGSITGPYVLCSLQTARAILELRPDQTTYLLGRCRSPDDLPGILARINGTGKVSAYTKEQFSSMSRSYWLWTTKAGLGIGFMALISLAFGAMVTSQTLYAATVSAIKELALLRALGTPRWRLRRFVMEQAFLVGSFGVLVGVPASYAVAFLARAVGARTLSPLWLIVGTVILTLIMSLLAGLVALRSLRQTEPIQLLR